MQTTFKSARWTVDAGRLVVSASESLITHRFSLDDVQTALDKSTKSIKVHLNPS